MDENPYKSPAERAHPVPRWRALLLIAGVALSIVVVVLAVVMLALLFAPADFFRR